MWYSFLQEAIRSSVMNASILWRRLVHLLHEVELEELFQAISRYSKRKLLLIFCALIFVVYYLGIFTGRSALSPAGICVAEHLKNWEAAVQEESVGVGENSVIFVGNGNIGVDVNEELRLSSNGSKILDFAAGFHPLVKIDVSGVGSPVESTFTEFNEGRVRNVKCYVIDSECMCIIRVYYAHRTRKELLVEEVKVVNPTKSSINLKIIRHEAETWTANKTLNVYEMKNARYVRYLKQVAERDKTDEHKVYIVTKRLRSVWRKMEPNATKIKDCGETVVYTRAFPSHQSSLLSAVICSSAPGEYMVPMKREETLRFVCVVEQGKSISNMAVDTKPVLQDLARKAISGFSLLNKMDSLSIDTEHENAWRKLNVLTFYFSRSKAPNILSGAQINATKYILLSNSKAPMLEESTPEDKRKVLELSSRRNERCYSEHSTLLYPSKLWHDWAHVEDLLRMADLWLLTLEKRGCAALLKSGATGLAQAFVLSLSGASYHDSHLEVALSISDLHRELAFGGLPIGVGVAEASARVRIDGESLTPYFEVSATGTLYACGGGCLGEPITLSKIPTKLEIKITKPETAILYIATSRRHLEQLRSTIHVSEVISVPAHESRLIALHRHGSAVGGLPIWFWFFLGKSFAGFLDIARKDVDIPNKAPEQLLAPLHLKFLTNYEKNKDSYEYVMAEPLRLSGMYWCVSAVSILNKPVLNREAIIEYIRECQRPDGGFAPASCHDSHLLHTLSAVQILLMYGAMETFDLDSVADYVQKLQNVDGSFGGDASNEVDTRFSFCAVATLYLIDKLNAIDVDKAVEYVLKCYNFDGGFGTRPGSESHAGQVYCCLGTLCITQRLSSIDRDRTAEWLAQRQCASGGLNGRPEKLPDVCYSWWVLASLAILRRLNWVDKEALTRFIYACQDDETGGFSDRPGDCSDPFHTVFGVAGLSLLGTNNLNPVDAVFCMPKYSLKQKSLC